MSAPSSAASSAAAHSQLAATCAAAAAEPEENHKKRAADDDDPPLANKKPHTDGAGAAAASSSSAAASVHEPLPSWDAAEWSRKFKIAEQAEKTHKPRQEVFQSTLQVIRRRGYQAEDGTEVALASCAKMQVGTKAYEETDSLPVPLAARRFEETRITVREGDCLEAAHELMQANADSAPAVLNMAYRWAPGGGVLGGAGAQEENLFRRSALLCSLYQFAEFADQYADCQVAPSAVDAYPIEYSGGGIYTPATQVFRSSEKMGYALLSEPYEVAFLTVPAISRKHEGAQPLSYAQTQTTKIKIRTMLRMAFAHAHTDLVLSAFGCGAFGNPPAEVAALFAAVFDEAEFRGVFREIVFAIFDDHNTYGPHNPEGNFKPFQQQFAAAANAEGNENE